MTRTNTWLVKYIVRYLRLKDEGNEWEYKKEYKEDEFKCLKGEIKTQVAKKVCADLKGVRHKNLFVTILTMQITQKEPLCVDHPNDQTTNTPNN